MNKAFLTGCLFFCVSLVFAQKVLVLENLTIGKSYRFFVGDDITIKVNDTTKKISGKITEILDSAITISNYNVYSIKEITYVFKHRKGLEIVSASLMTFGGLFFALDIVNNMLNGDSPVIKPEVVLVSAAVTAVGGLLQPFTKRKCLIQKNKWRLKIIDEIHVKSE